MTLFRRRHPAGPDPTPLLVATGRARIEQTTQAHRQRWGLGSEQLLELDRTTGTLRWTFPDHVVEATADPIATVDPRDGSWLWAWADRSLPRRLRRPSRAMRAWGRANDEIALVGARLILTPEMTADLIPLAFEVSGTSGLCRIPVGDAELLCGFRAVEIVGADGRRETFDAGV